jgi:hypothetical protein
MIDGLRATSGRLIEILAVCETAGLDAGGYRRENCGLMPFYNKIRIFLDKKWFRTTEMIKETGRRRKNLNFTDNFAQGFSHRRFFFLFLGRLQILRTAGRKQCGQNLNIFFFADATHNLISGPRAQTLFRTHFSVLFVLA